MNTIVNNIDKVHARGRFDKRKPSLEELYNFSFRQHFTPTTLKVMFWAQEDIELDYMGG